MDVILEAVGSKSRAFFNFGSYSLRSVSSAQQAFPIQFVFQSFIIILRRITIDQQYNRKIYSKNKKTMEGNQILLKLISIGDAKTGKSCIIKRYCQGKFVNKYITTIGVDYGVKKVNVNGKNVAVNFFDISGSPDYEQIRNPFFEHSQIALLVFDVGSKQSFQNISRWQNTMRNNGLDLKQCVVFLLGNKTDNKNRQVESAQAIAYAKKKGYEYYQTSAATGQNINELFQKAFQKAVYSHEEKRKAIIS